MNGLLLDYLVLVFLMLAVGVGVIALRSIRNEHDLLVRVVQLEQQVGMLQKALTDALRSDNVKGERILLLEKQVNGLEQENLKILRRLYVYEEKEKEFLQ